jgi:hypothetical protein
MHSTPQRSDGAPKRDPIERDTAFHRRDDVSVPVKTGRNRSAERLRALLAKRSAVWTIIAASLTLCAPAIATGYIYDDYFHTVALRADTSASGIQRAPWDAYNFASTPAHVQQLIEACAVPWWSDLHARMAFFRPLGSLTLWLDHQLWPESPALMHIQSLCWYGLLLLVTASVYRRFSASLGFAGLALLLYGIDDAHAWSVGWLANRAALGALAFGFAALLAHDRWRSTGRARFLLGALGLLAVAFGFGESAVQALAYFVAYAWFFDAKRWRSLLPYAALLVAWRVAYSAAGYGAAGTSFYTDPIRNPLEFLQAMMERLPVLVAAQLGGLSADLGGLLQYAAPGWTIALALLCLGVTGVAAWLFYPLWSTRREVRFWALGMVLSMIPVCALPPADRLLVAPGLGGSALIAILLLAALDRAREARSPARKLWVGAIALVHLVIAPLCLPVQAYALLLVDKYIGDAEESIPAGPEVADKTVVLLNPPTDEFGIFGPMRRRARGEVMPKHLRWIANGDSDLTLTRIDATTLKVRPSQGFSAPGSIGTLRTLEFKSHVGDVVTVEGMAVTILEVTDDGRPAEVQVKFEQPLDDRQLVWMRWNDRDGFAPFELPQPGHSILVPGIDARSVLVD